jgi:hypothetical protein
MGLREEIEEAKELYELAGNADSLSEMNILETKVIGKLLLIVTKLWEKGEGDETICKGK